ncbi:hypothetical protein BDY19DRAFT_483217 [Irpex rosettiformis]|uniref:Uncharacterized protein n=1 Tax=Irpex rosettiformis TaxID=378272 RepID=A0ACB8UE30_9APHY|nr:hypothetical protein BDY19DRAFT_483217 [Irpex rosettiformis]
MGGLGRSSFCSCRRLSGCLRGFSVNGGGDGRSNYSNEEGTITQPLRIVKKSREHSTKEKERPNWYTDAGLEYSLPAPAHSEQRSTSRLASQHVVDATPSGNIPPTAIVEEREPTPPPKFEPVGPSLEGPPYEGYHDSEAPTVTQRSGLVMAYVPGDSRPASPLHSPTSSSLSQAQVHVSPPSQFAQPLPQRRTLPRPPSRTSSPSIPHSERRAQHQQSAPPPPRPAPQRQGLRPTASFRDSLKTQSYLPPRVAFDPRVAYGDKDRSSYFNIPEEPSLHDVDPASFYTASVSSIYSTGARRTRTTSITPSSLYSQSTYSLPQTQPHQSFEQPQAHYPARESIRSPAPSVHSVTSQPSSHIAQQSFSGIQQYQPPSSAPAHMSTYQPTTYQPTIYQPTAYQPTSYQSQQFQQQYHQPQQSAYPTTAYQQHPVSNPHPSNGYHPTAY